MKHLYQKLALGLMLLLGLQSVATSQSGPRWYFNIDKNNTAISGYDVVAYHTEAAAQKGKVAISSTYKGVTYLFAKEANKQLFEKTPKRYLPAYGGWCTYFMGIDQQATQFPPTRMQPDPTSFKVINEQLYLFRKTTNQDFGAAFGQGDKEAILERADSFWQTRVAFGERSKGLPEGLNPMARMENIDWLPFMGLWESRVEWWNDTTGAVKSGFKGEWEFKYGYFGYAVEDDFRGIPDLPFAGTQNGPAVRGFDVQNQEWHMTYIPVNQPRAATWLMTGKFIAPGHLEGFLESKDPYGNEILQKVIFKMIDKDAFEWQAQWSWDEGETWKEKAGFATVRRLK